MKWFKINFAADLEAPPPDPTSVGLAAERSTPTMGVPSAVIGRQQSVNDMAPLIANRTSSLSSYGTDDDLAVLTTPGMLIRTQLYPPGRLMLLTPPIEEGDRPVVEWVTHR